MLLTLDIGNTNISYGLFKRKKLIKGGKISTESAVYLSCLDKLSLAKIENAIISSVVPQSLKKLKKEFREKLSVRLFILGENMFVPIVNLYKKPKEVGQDRLVNAYAGYQLYGGGLIIIDFGTAVTFDLVSQKGKYLGGMIFPGMMTSFEALCQRAALLPKNMKLLPPKQLIGTSTKESIRSGIYYGFASLTNCIVRRFRQKYGKALKVLITGGDAQKIYPLLGNMGILNPDLTLKGLMMIYENMRNNEERSLKM